MPHTILYKCRLCWIYSFVVVVLLLLFCCCSFVVVVVLLFCCFVVLFLLFFFLYLPLLVRGDQTITSSHNCERTMPRTIHNAAHNSQCHAQLQPMWLCIISSWCFEDTFENAQWRKVKQMQPMWLCLLWYKFFMETFENTQWRKA